MVTNHYHKYCTANSSYLKFIYIHWLAGRDFFRNKPTIGNDIFLYFLFVIFMLFFNVNFFVSIYILVKRFQSDFGFYAVLGPVREILGT